MNSEQKKLIQQLSIFTDNDFVKTSKFYVVKAISEMNIAMLEVILNEEYSYQETTKEIFLEKLNQIFEAHKSNGDTALLPYQGACVADITSCENCGKRGFRFVGNHSNNYLDLIFEIEENEIKDMCHCGGFETDVKLDDLNYSANFYINEDDKVTFNKTPTYWAKVNAANDAYSEIITSPTKILDFEEVCYWVDKHAFTNNEIGHYDVFEPMMKWHHFSRLYDKLNEIKIFITTHLNEIIKANKSLQQLISGEDIIDWVIQQETIIKEVSFDLKHSFDKRDQYYVSNKSNFIDLYGEVFDEVFSYLDSFEKHNKILLDKFRVYTFNECVSIDNERDWNENNVDLFSLSFHFQTRKELESQGMAIPFYIEKSSDDELKSEIE